MADGESGQIASGETFPKSSRCEGNVGMELSWVTGPRTVSGGRGRGCWGGNKNPVCQARQAVWVGRDFFSGGSLEWKAL